MPRSPRRLARLAIGSRALVGQRACCRFTLSEPYLLGANMDLIDLSDGNKLVWTGPALEPRECLGSVVSNGRLFYTAQASGLQACLTNKD